MAKKSRRDMIKRKRDLDVLIDKIDTTTDEAALKLLQKERDELIQLIDYRENGDYGI